MKTSGIIRKVDELGRVVLPIELRRSLGIEERDSLEITLDDDRIILRKLESSCIFCGKEADLLEHRGKYICAECLKEMNDQED